MPQLPGDALARWLEENAGISGGFAGPKSHELPEEVELALAAVSDAPVPTAMITTIANVAATEAEALPRAGAPGTVPSAAATAGAKPAETIDLAMPTTDAPAPARTPATDDVVKHAMPFTLSSQESEASVTTPGDDGTAQATPPEAHTSRKLTALGQSPVPPAENEDVFAAPAPSGTETKPASQPEAAPKGATRTLELTTALPDSALLEPGTPLQQPEARMMAREASGIWPLQEHRPSQTRVQSCSRLPRLW